MREADLPLEALSLLSRLRGVSEKAEQLKNEFERDLAEERERFERDLAEEREKLERDIAQKRRVLELDLAEKQRLIEAQKEESDRAREVAEALVRDRMSGFKLLAEAWANTRT